MMKNIYTVRLNNGLTAPCDCNYVSIIQGDIIGYMDLRGALRFSTKQEATDAPSAGTGAPQAYCCRSTFLAAALFSTLRYKNGRLSGEDER